MNRTLLALMIFALASNAGARGNDLAAILQCGVKLGDRYHTYKTDSERAKGWDKRLNHVAGVARVEPGRFATYDTRSTSLDADMFAQSSAVEIRLPRKVTVATLGCSWL